VSAAVIVVVIVVGLGAVGIVLGGLSSVNTAIVERLLGRPPATTFRTSLGSADIVAAAREAASVLPTHEFDETATSAAFVTSGTGERLVVNWGEDSSRRTQIHVDCTGSSGDTAERFRGALLRSLRSRDAGTSQHSKLRGGLT